MESLLPRRVAYCHQIGWSQLPLGYIPSPYLSTDAASLNQAAIDNAELPEISNG